MIFNGVELRTVHRALSVEKEIPPGTAGRAQETIETADGGIGRGVEADAHLQLPIVARAHSRKILRIERLGAISVIDFRIFCSRYGNGE